MIWLYGYKKNTSAIGLSPDLAVVASSGGLGYGTHLELLGVGPETL